jgi:hypothetical protein
MTICWCMKYEQWEMWEIVGNMVKIKIQGMDRCEIAILNMLKFSI